MEALDLRMSTLMGDYHLYYAGEEIEIQFEGRSVRMLVDSVDGEYITFKLLKGSKEDFKQVVHVLSARSFGQGMRGVYRE